MNFFKRKIKIYRVSARSLSTQDWELIDERKTLKAAINLANKYSLKAGVETEIMGMDEEYDIAYHSYHENGKLSINMCV